MFGYNPRFHIFCEDFSFKDNINFNEVYTKGARKLRAGLIKKIYEADLLVRTKWKWQMPLLLLLKTARL